MNEQIAKIRDILGDRRNTHGICPYCEGGGRRETSLSIWTDDDTGLVFYKCHRATCRKAGLVHGEVRDRPENNNEDWKPNPYRGELQAITHDMWDVALGRWFYYETDRSIITVQRICWSKELVALMFPLFDRHGSSFGYEAKNMGGPFRWKSKKFLERRCPLIHYPHQLNSLRGEEIYLVEDIISAIKISRMGIPAAAMLGSRLGESEVLDLRQLKPKKIILMPDGDEGGIIGARKSISRYNHLLPMALRMPPIGKDPKHMTVAEMKRFL